MVLDCLSSQFRSQAQRKDVERNGLDAPNAVNCCS